MDQCTTVGPVLTNAIISLPPGGLSTWQPVNEYDDTGLDVWRLGQIWNDPKGGNIEFDIDFSEGVASVDLKDLACPTWGLGYSTSDDGTVITTIGPPYLPIIIPPMDAFSLDPIWASACTAMYTDPAGLTTLALFDPPIALTTGALLLPTPTARPTLADPTTEIKQAPPSAKPAKPASIPNDAVAPPARTGDPGKAGPADPKESVVPVPSPGENPPAQRPVAPSASTGDPRKTSLTDPKAPVLPDPLLGDGPPARTGDSGKADPKNPETPVIPVSLPGEDPPAQRQGLGAIIFGAFGKSEPGADGSSPVLRPLQSIITIGAQTFTANPTGFTVNNVAVTPGGSPYVVDKTIISLGQSGVLAIGSSTVSLLDPVSSTILAVAGQTFTPNPTAFPIAGTTISAGGPAVTVDRTVISLGQSGALDIGSSTVNIPPQPYTFSEVYTVAGQTFTPNPSAFSIAGTTISAGGPAVTVDGTIISLGQSGALAIGSSTVNIPHPSYTLGEVYTVAGQTFTPNPSAFSIDGTTISANGPAATIDGTIVNLGPSGNLIIGSSTIPLLNSHVSSSTDVNIDGFDVQAQHSSSFVVVDGVTLSAAASGVVISGTVVSLEAGGATLDIGTGRFALPTPTGTPNGLINVQAFTGGQSQGMGMMSLSLICGVFCVTLVLLM